MNIHFPQLNVDVKARLLDNLAPKTCAWIWEMLKSPVENELWHVTFLGLGLTCRYTLPHQDAATFPPENLTITPSAGDILLVNFTEKTGRTRGITPGESDWQTQSDQAPGTYAGFDLFYGPDSRMFIPMGFLAAPHCLTIQENLEELARIGHLTRVEGAKQVVFSRIDQLQ